MAQVGREVQGQGQCVSVDSRGSTSHSHTLLFTAQLLGGYLVEDAHSWGRGEKKNGEILLFWQFELLVLHVLTYSYHEESIKVLVEFQKPTKLPIQCINDKIQANRCLIDVSFCKEEQTNETWKIENE